MAAIVGQRVTQQESAEAPRLPARTKASPPFVYIHHPHRWQFIEASAEWLPLLGKMKIDPGVGGVTDARGTDLAVAQNTRRGWQAIRPSDERLGEYQWYVQKIPKSGGGLVHADASVTVETIGGRAFWTGGGDAYKAFLRHLISSGIVMPMNDKVKRLKVEQQRQTVDRLSSSVAAAPHNQVLLARLAAATKTLESMEAPAQKPKPKPTAKASA